MDDIIEAIARRWFETLPATKTPNWESQPEHLKDVFRAKAKRFWNRPSDLTDTLNSVAIRTRQMTIEIDRATGDWG